MRSKESFEDEEEKKHLHRMRRANEHLHRMRTRHRMRKKNIYIENN